MSEESIGRTSIQVIERMMMLLDTLAKHHEPVALKDLARETQLHPSTAHRILNDLVACRLVDRTEQGLYRLGMRLLELGNQVKARINVRESALALMQKLHRLTGQTVNLSVRQGDEIVYVDRAYSERSGMQVVRAIGGHAPLHLTSTGKLFLATETSENLKLYAERTLLQGTTPNSLNTLDKLNNELIQIRKEGFARDNEELEMGVSCIAAGIYDDSSTLIAGLSISAPSGRIQESWLQELVHSAQRISVSLGWKNQVIPMNGRLKI
jgi:DNA-binding IclR family transcriptional regulator